MMFHVWPKAGDGEVQPVQLLYARLGGWGAVKGLGRRWRLRGSSRICRELFANVLNAVKGIGGGGGWGGRVDLGECLHKVGGPQ